MYKCREIPEIASDYISRDCSAKTRLLVAFHLAQCSNCRTYVRGLKTARSITAQSFRGSVPDDVLRNLGLTNPGQGGSSKEPGK